MYRTRLAALEQLMNATTAAAENAPRDRSSISTISRHSGRERLPSAGCITSQSRLRGFRYDVDRCLSVACAVLARSLYPVGCGADFGGGGQSPGWFGVPLSDEGSSMSGGEFFEDIRSSAKLSRPLLLPRRGDAGRCAHLVNSRTCAAACCSSETGSSRSSIRPPAAPQRRGQAGEVHSRSCSGRVGKTRRDQR